ncbi:MAG: hypothetical protein QOH31_3338 [Verrucomicrobiota bacterium]
MKKKQTVLERIRTAANAEDKRELLQEFKAEFVALSEELTPKITQASTFPPEAPQPDEIRQAVDRLKALEPLISKMSVNVIFGDDGPYLLTQRIQRYYYQRNILDDPLLAWARSVATKFLLQRQLLEARPESRHRLQIKRATR